MQRMKAKPRVVAGLAIVAVFYGLCAALLVLDRARYVTTIRYCLAAHVGIVVTGAIAVNRTRICDSWIKPMSRASAIAGIVLCFEPMRPFSMPLLGVLSGVQFVLVLLRTRGPDETGDTFGAYVAVFAILMFSAAVWFLPPESATRAAWAFALGTPTILLVRHLVRRLGRGAQRD